MLALQNTQYVPVPDYRDVVYSASIEHVSWMKYAVWSFIPYISINVGYFLLMLIIIVIAMGLMLTMKNYIGRFTCFEISSILTIVIHVMYFSPKWNLAPMIGLILLLQQKEAYLDALPWEKFSNVDRNTRTVRSLIKLTSRYSK